MINPPYPSDLEAKGWALDLDYEKIDQSDTWAISKPEQKPWLLMLWLIAWRQVPIASLPNNDRLIAARIGMPADQFTEWRDVLLSGFELATDGRLYHKTLTTHVLRMASKRDKDRARVAAWRAKGAAVGNADERVSNDRVAPCNALPTRDLHVSNTDVRVSTTPTPTPTPTPIKEQQRALENADIKPETLAAKAMIAAGMIPTKCNQSDPRLSAAIAEGATPDMFAALVPGIPPSVTSPMAWVVAAVRGQLADARTKGAASGSVAPVFQNDHSKTMAEVLRGQ